LTLAAEPAFRSGDTLSSLGTVQFFGGDLVVVPHADHDDGLFSV
jgi:hypothetical protein